MAAGPKNQAKPPYSGGFSYFLSIMHREITPTITMQNSNNSLYVIIGITSLRRGSDQPPNGNSIVYFNIIYRGKYLHLPKSSRVMLQSSLSVE